jgi:hypothetical protein
MSKALLAILALVLVVLAVLLVLDYNDTRTVDTPTKTAEPIGAQHPKAGKP